MTPVINMYETGKNIEELRKKNGFTVKDLQEALQPISPQAIYKWQHGESVPSTDNLVILSDLFHVPIDQIIVRDYIQNYEPYEY